MTESISNVFSEITENLKRNKSFALATIIKTDASSPREVGARMIVYPDKKICGTIGGGPLEAKVISDAIGNINACKKQETISYNLDMNEKPNLGMRCGGRVEILIETFLPTSRLVILGGGHVGERLAAVSREIHFPFIVVDDREEFSRPERFPGAIKVVHCPLADVFKTVIVDDETYIVVVTRCHAQDEICLRSAIKTNARYIGMIGSRNKIKEVFDRLESKGIKVKDDKRVYAPIGLYFGDKTPEHIAMSVMSEILVIKTTGTLTHRRIFHQQT